MSSQRYNVPVILPDLRKEESIRQLVDSLEYLDAVALDIFNRVSSRVAENRDELISINNRINLAQAKIDKIRNTTSKATRVFSPPKYPAPDKLTNYESMFRDVNVKLQQVRENRAMVKARVVEVTRETIKAKMRPQPIGYTSTAKKFREGVVMDDPELLGEGLGSLPRHLPSVSSLLLFNTSENPYRKYVLLDPLSGAKVKTRDTVAIEEDKMAAAPSSILHGERLESGPQESTLYRPNMPDLPELEVPASLPFLAHIADDVEYTADLGPSIAPSLANTSVPELPNLADQSFVPSEPLPPHSDTGPPPPPPTDTGGPPPPPPPPPPSVAPIPPPPALPGDSGDSDDSEGEGPAPAPQGVPDASDGRASLMDAIRKAGGAGKAGLKNAKNRKQARKAKKEEVKSSSPGDLLGDLSAALGRRRKAMSGKDKREDLPSTGGGSMMDKVAAMIPAPTITEGSDESDDGGGGGDW